MLIKEPPEDVYLFPCRDYRAPQLDPVMEELLPGLVGDTSLVGATVLLKPNLISSRAQALACTNGAFVAAAARWFIARGAKIGIGDSPAFGSVRAVLSRHGILQQIEGLDIDIVRFRTPRVVELDIGVKVSIAAEAMECDLLVNLPKLKAHNQMYVTGAVKNYFGTVVGMNKAMMHMHHGASHSVFSDILVRIPGLFPHSISVIDGVEAMHRSGPIDGESVHVGVVGGSRCPVALDAAVLEMLSLPKEKSPMWRAARALGHPGNEVSRLSFPGFHPETLRTEGFIAPDGLNPIRFNPMRFLLGAMRRISLAFRA